MELPRLIAVLDDEPDIVELISTSLKKAGFEVASFLEARSLLQFMASRRPDLILLDLMLPDADGFELFKFLRSKGEWSSIPVIMVTARSDETDRVVGLELGADDYVTKPFSPKELVARVKAVLRRFAPEMKTQRIEIERILIIDLERHEVIADEKKIDLTPTEFKILTLLASRVGRVMTREQILDHLWGHEKIVVDRTVDVHVKNLRQKLGPAAAALIKNVRGVGYKLER